VKGVADLELRSGSERWLGEPQPRIDRRDLALSRRISGDDEPALDVRDVERRVEFGNG